MFLSCMYKKKTIFSFICLTEYIVNIGNIVTMCTNVALFLWSRYMACGDGLSDYNHRSWLLLQKWLEYPFFYYSYSTQGYHSQSCYIRRFCQSRDNMILPFLYLGIIALIVTLPIPLWTTKIWSNLECIHQSLLNHIVHKVHPHAHKHTC